MNTNYNEQKLLNIDELSNFLGVKKQTIYCWVSQGQIPSFKVGRLIRFDLKQIRKWLNSININRSAN